MSEHEKNWYGNYDAQITDLIGKTIDSIEGGVGDWELRFKCQDGTVFQMKYYSDCCASCYLEDICGELKDLVGSPILSAEEATNRQDNPGGVKPETIEYQDSFTWTFYKLATIKGSVTLRWYGSSNGYYSESVTFERLQENISL